MGTKEIKEIKERLGTPWEMPGDLLRLNILEDLKDINCHSSSACST